MSKDSLSEKLREFLLSPTAQALIQESDRGCVIVGAAFLEDQLEALLRALSRDDDESIKQVIKKRDEAMAAKIMEVVGAAERVLVIVGGRHRAGVTQRLMDAGCLSDASRFPNRMPHSKAV